jgi:hypothetical protein
MLVEQIEKSMQTRRAVVLACEFDVNRRFGISGRWLI